MIIWQKRFRCLTQKTAFALFMKKYLVANYKKHLINLAVDSKRRIWKILKKHVPKSPFLDYRKLKCKNLRIAADEFFPCLWKRTLCSISAFYENILQNGLKSKSGCAIISIGRTFQPGIIRNDIPGDFKQNQPIYLVKTLKFKNF